MRVRCVRRDTEAGTEPAGEISGKAGRAQPVKNEEAGRNPQERHARQPPAASPKTRAQKQKGDAVQRVARSVDRVNRKVTAA